MDYDDVGLIAGIIAVLIIIAAIAVPSLVVLF
jgi:Flp pilus assembly pilin Flp